MINITLCESSWSEVSSVDSVIIFGVTYRITITNQLGKKAATKYGTIFYTYE